MRLQTDDSCNCLNDRNNKKNAYEAMMVVSYFLHLVFEQVYLATIANMFYLISLICFT